MPVVEAAFRRSACPPAPTPALLITRVGGPSNHACARRRPALTSSMPRRRTARRGRCRPRRRCARRCAARRSRRCRCTRPGRRGGPARPSERGADAAARAGDDGVSRRRLRLCRRPNMSHAVTPRPGRLGWRAGLRAMNAATCAWPGLASGVESGQGLEDVHLVRPDLQFDSPPAVRMSSARAVASAASISAPPAWMSVGGMMRARARRRGSAGDG